MSFPINCSCKLMVWVEMTAFRPSRRAICTAGAGWVSWHLWLKPGAIAGSNPLQVDSGPPLKPTDVAVLYFDDFSLGGELEYLANGITEALIHELSQVEALRVVSRNGVKPFRDPTISLDSLARVLGVGSIVEGSVEGSGDESLALRRHVRCERAHPAAPFEGLRACRFTLREAGFIDAGVLSLQQCRHHAGARGLHGICARGL